MPERLLVCGGRSFGFVPKDYDPAEHRELARVAAAQRELMDRMLEGLVARCGVSVLMHGAQKGADYLAGQWARRNGIEELRFPADWRTLKKAAGPIRNRRMIDEGRPTLVMAFPGHAGTRSMVEIARAAGVPVREVA